MHAVGGYVKEPRGVNPLTIIFFDPPFNAFVCHNSVHEPTMKAAENESVNEPLQNFDPDLYHRPQVVLGC